jgi:hypothetical protein
LALARFTLKRRCRPNRNFHSPVSWFFEAIGRCYFWTRFAESVGGNHLYWNTTLD